MVHIKCVELNHFKSFGGSVRIPLLPGFTVVSGPNGSGKSNILDGLLFCLGLSSSKGMRADRLPDLINNKHSGNGRISETIVSVTFDLTDLADLEDLVTKVNLNPSEPEAVKGLPQNGLVEADKEAEIDSQKIVAIANNGALEWKVTRRLRVNKKGNYASTFYINGQTVTATELHEQ